MNLLLLFLDFTRFIDNLDEYRFFWLFVHGISQQVLCQVLAG